MRYRILLGIALILCATRLCFPPWQGKAREVTTTNYSSVGSRSDSSIRFLDWRILARWRFADNDLSQDRFYAEWERLFAQSQSAAVSESLSIVKQDPLAFIFDSVSRKKVNVVRDRYSDQIEKGLKNSGRAETTALRAAGVPLERMLPKFQSQIYGWRSRSYTFELTIDNRRLLFEAGIAAILCAAAFVLAPVMQSLRARRTSSDSAA